MQNHYYDCNVPLHMHEDRNPLLLGYSTHSRPWYSKKFLRTTSLSDRIAKTSCVNETTDDYTVQTVSIVCDERELLSFCCWHA